MLLSPNKEFGRFLPYQCDQCQNLGIREQKHVNRKLREGNDQCYCSRACVATAARTLFREPACIECGGELTHRHQFRFCSTSCSAKASNRNRDQSHRVKQSESLKTSPAARAARKLVADNRRERYRLNPSPCVQCGGPKPWPKRHQRTCGQECAIASLSNPERSAKISAARKKRFADGSLQVTGGNTKWLDYKDIRVQGTYELRACHILDAWKDSGRIIDWEYTNDRVPYTNVDGKESTYLLDFKVWDQAGVHYIETKGYATDNDALKWAAAAGTDGLNVQVWFEKDIALRETELRYFGDGENTLIHI
jgi:hypothetical protein